MNLILDIGNTQIKAAVFNQHELVHLESSKETEVEFADAIIRKYPKVENVIISSVRHLSNNLLSFIENRSRKLFLLNADLPIPLENLYESKNTLGYDRLAACAGACDKYPKSNILVIDAGTAITFDFVNDKAQYLGGCISPGLNMRFKALNQFTQKLPHLSINQEFNLIGKNTNDAVISGVQNGIVFEVDSYINNIRNQYPNLKVVLTGGDAIFIHKFIKNHADLQPEILLEGLNSILEFNLLHRS